MSFLAPLFLAGAAAVVLPIVFHLIRRTSRERMVFSSLMFLQPTPPRVTRRNRLENIFLLLLRCVAFCLLALAFSRPFLQRPEAGDPPAEPARRLVILLDTSASMRRDGLWEAAVAKADSVLNSTRPGEQVSVFTFDRQTRRLVSFEEWDAMNIADRAANLSAQLKILKPGWSSSRFGDALITAAEYFTEADKKGQVGGTRRIVLISDLQEGSRLDGLQGYEWPRGIEVAIEPIKPKRPTNAGMHPVADSEIAIASDAAAGPRVRISNSSDATREQFQIRWDGVAGAPVVDAYVPPGQSRILAAPKLPAGAVGERLVLSGDDDDFDNVIYLVQSKPSQVKVAYAGSETASDPAESLYYLKRAFQQTRRQEVEVVPLSAAASETRTNFQDPRLLIVGGSGPGNTLQAAQQVLSGGGTVLFVIRNVGAATQLGALAGTNNPTITEAEGGGYSMLGQIDFEHPLFAPFADPRFSDFTRIHFWKHRKLDAAALPNARVLARFDNGDPALLEIPKGKGRLLVLTSGWQPGDSQLALSSKFVPLMYSILDQTGGTQPHATQYQVGDDVALTATVAGGPITVEKPDGTRVELKSGETRFPGTEAPGIYTMAAAQPPMRFAVNLDAAESRTAPLAVEGLERLGVPLKTQEVELAKQIEQKRRLHDAELESQQKLWRKLIVAALVVLLVETWLAGWLTRAARLPVPTHT